MTPLLWGDINVLRLAHIGLDNPEQGLRLLHELAGQGVSDDDIEPLLASLLAALQGAPDPDRALSSFSRWFASVGGRYSYLQMLLRHPVALQVFCLVTGSSQYFADLLVRHPERFELIANPGGRGGAKSEATFYTELSALVSACQQFPLKKDALRRWKAREMLRIGIRDLVGLGDMPSTAREFSNLADACVQCAYDITCSQFPLSPLSQTPPIAVIGMGKLGGRELNYSSDIDLVFVHGDDLPYEMIAADGRRVETVIWVARFAESLIKTLSEESANGHVFRVDMRLRPEGRFGSLSRSLSGFRAYYESWAENWERQALLKARFIAGDRPLGDTYMTLVEGYVFRNRVTSVFLQDMKDNKRRIEKHCELERQTETNIKTGYGGIRDIEFIVQRFQLEYGGKLTRLRTPNTLHGVQKLRQARLLTETEAGELSRDYQFLRNLEHRLQLLQGFQTQNLPPAQNERERYQVARRMGRDTREAFERELAQVRERTHSHLSKLFYEEIAEDLSDSAKDGGEWAEIGDLLELIDTQEAQSRLKELLAKAGFQHPPNALRALQLPMRGNDFGAMPPDTPAKFKAIVALLLSACAYAPDPDAALAGLEDLATAVPNRAHLYASFHDSPEVMYRLVQLAGSAPHLFQKLVRHQEWMETLFTQNEEEAEILPLAKEIRQRLAGIKRQDAKTEALARFHQRETLRIALREIVGESAILNTVTALTELAETTLASLLETCAEEIATQHAEPEFARRVLERVAVIGMGKLGGSELGYSSDWDVVFAYENTRHPDDLARRDAQYALANGLVEKVLAAGKTLLQKGATLEIDLRLRPWGRAGSLIYSPRALLQYYRGAMETWERHASLKSRFIAGNRYVGKRFERLLREVSFGRGISEEENGAIQAMKRRIENERLKPNERDSDLKLGHGGLMDTEWLAQRLQLLHGSQFRSLWVPNTLQALTALTGASLLDNAAADVLTAGYLLLSRTRNALWLTTGASLDCLPDDAVKQRRVACLMGYVDADALLNDLHSSMRETRRIFEQRFY